METYKSYFYQLTLLTLIILISIFSIDHYIDGNIAVYPLHAFELATSGNLSFSIKTELDPQIFYPNFHSFLYILYLAIFFKLYSLIGHLDAYSMNLLIKLANFSLILITGYIVSLFFSLNRNKKIYLMLAYILLPSSILGYLSAVEDQVLTPIFLLLTFYFIGKQKNLIWIVIAGSLSILSKETTGSLGLIMVLFGEVFILKRISFYYSLKIAIYSFILATITYTILCALFSLDPLFILYTTSGHLAGGGFKIENVLLQVRYIIQSFTPFILIFLPLFYFKNIYRKKYLIFGCFLFVAITSVNILTGYINIRYLSAFIPIILVTILKSYDLGKLYNERTSYIAMFISLLFIILVDDSYLLISNIKQMGTYDLVYSFTLVSIFSVFSILASKIDRFRGLHFFVLVSSIIFLHLSLKDYQIGYSHGQSQIKEVIESVDNDSFIFSDLPSPEFYFRNRVIHTTSPVSHFFSENSWGGDVNSLEIDLDASKQIHDVFREGFVLSNATSLPQFYVWTLEGSITQSFFQKKYDCKDIVLNENSTADHQLLLCTNNKAG